MGILYRKPKHNKVILILKKLGQVEFYLTENKGYGEVLRIPSGTNYCQDKPNHYSLESLFLILQARSSWRDGKHYFIV